MRFRLPRCAVVVFLSCIPLGLYAQEPYEARAARLQPEEIPGLIQKADSGDFPSQVLLWLAYSHGYAVPKNIPEGVPYLRLAAEHGCTECQWELSNVYQFGRGGIPKDYDEAFKWALKAAERGHPVAQHNVGSDYLSGTGVEVNLERARYWLTKAAGQGFAHSQWLLARMYLKGAGMPPNRDEALKWLTMAIAQEHAPSMETLAEMFTDPNDVPQQPQLVFDLHRAAAQLGDHYSEFELGRIYLHGYLGAPDYTQAFVWFGRAAAVQYGPAFHEIAQMYESGQGTAANFATALSNYERAADLGVSSSIQRIGEINRDGIGKAADRVSAAMWFTIGSKMGAEESQRALEALQPRLTPGESQMAAAKANTWMVEHPQAMQQKPGHYFYQGWIAVSQEPKTSRAASTKEERDYAIFLTERLKKDPLSLDAAAARAWLDKWWQDIPDYTVRPCNLVEAPDHEKYAYSTEVYKQVTYSEGEYILEHPSQPTDWDAAFLAGTEGALDAYAAILKQKSSATYPFLDDLERQRGNQTLSQTVHRLAQERCKF